MNDFKQYAAEAISLLQELISIPSLSRDEDNASDAFCKYLQSKSIVYERVQNNILVRSKDWDNNKPTILLNSHIDTVKPASTYTRNPFSPDIENGILYGLGSNDAGASLVSLLMAFQLLSSKPQNYNLLYIASAEEEVSGKNGIELALKCAPEIHFAVVGEPTQMHLAIAEKGLMVVDVAVKGVSGHAARNEGDNAIYKAIKDIAAIEQFQFPKVSPMLGPVKATVTGVNAGSQHNVVPDLCTYMIDIRTNELYSNQEVADIIQSITIGEATPRSTRLNSSFTPEDHPLVLRAKTLNRNTYGSPTLSDQALMAFTTVKCGPGDSARSHTADEYILLSEIENGIELYVKMLDKLCL